MVVFLCIFRGVCGERRERTWDVKAIASYFGFVQKRWFLRQRWHQNTVVQDKVGGQGNGFLIAFLVSSTVKKTSLHFQAKISPRGRGKNGSHELVVQLKLGTQNEQK